MTVNELFHTLEVNQVAALDPVLAALLLAQDEIKELNIHAYLNQIDEWAKLIKPKLLGLPLHDQITVLCDFLFVDLRFSGNREHYYDPRNSYLPHVIDRRLGIPLTLTLVVMGVAQRAGMDVHGVCMPGHFVAMAVGEGQKILIDPFDAGRFLSEQDCSRLIQESCGFALPWPGQWCVPATTHSIISRMCNNLRSIYLRLEDYGRAERILRRLTQLHPNVMELQRDIGICHLFTNQPRSALQHFTSYLQQKTAPEDAEAVQELLQKARCELAKLN